MPKSDKFGVFFEDLSCPLSSYLNAQKTKCGQLKDEHLVLKEDSRFLFLVSSNLCFEMTFPLFHSLFRSSLSLLDYVFLIKVARQVKEKRMQRKCKLKSRSETDNVLISESVGGKDDSVVNNKVTSKTVKVYILSLAFNPGLKGQLKAACATTYRACFTSKRPLSTRDRYDRD
jgi:hypothetical protein